MTKHEIIIYASWDYANSADLTVWCKTCGRETGSYEDGEVPLDVLNALAAQHAEEVKKR